MQDKLSTVIGQLIKETMDKRNFSYLPMSFFYPSLTVIFFNDAVGTDGYHKLFVRASFPFEKLEPIR